MKTTFLTLALCIMCANVKAQTVSVADVEALPGETVSFTLDLSGGKAETYIALQFDVHFPNNNFTTTGDYSVSSKWKNATSVVGSVDGDGVATIPVSSAETISDANVEGLLTIDFTVGSNVPVGEYDVTLKNIWFGYGTSSKDYVDDVTFKVNVVAQHTVILYEESTTAPENATGVNVTVKRTINANEWSTICLPFAMSESQVKAAFGDDVQLGDFVKYDTTEDGDENIIGISINLADATAIEANHPYTIKVSHDITEFTIEGVDIESDEESAYTEYNNGQTGKKKVIYGTFEGTLHAGKTLTENQLFLSGNQFWYSSGLTTIKAFRAYFAFMDVLSEVENASSRVVMKWNDEQPTGISEIKHEAQKNSQYYDLSGRRVVRPNKGVYIVDGKKTVIK